MRNSLHSIKVITSPAETQPKVTVQQIPDNQTQQFPPSKPAPPPIWPEKAKPLTKDPVIQDDYELSLESHLLLDAFSNVQFSKEEQQFISKFKNTWSDLFNRMDHHITVEDLRENLKALHGQFSQMDNYVQYRFFWGGSSLEINNPSDQTVTKRFPKYVKKILKKFQRTDLDNLNESELLEFRNELINMANNAKRASESSCCRYTFFKPRHRVTDRIYDTLSSATPISRG